MTTKEQLKEYLTELSGQEVDYDTPLISSGLIDSMRTMMLIMFLEQKFSLKTTALNFDFDTIDTINKIATLVDINHSADK